MPRAPRILWPERERLKRRHSAAADDQRSRYERDRDRILYSSAFRRLSGITQIVRAGEADVFHTRQQHTLKVAQVGRRLAQKCRGFNPKLCDAIGLDPEVVEAACLAHDLGHPPFGHIGEKVLHECVARFDANGYEGNAQSFRILTRISVRYADCPGLDLTRASLAACLKYPWMREPENPSRSKKWNAYTSEADDFLFSREKSKHHSRTPEAELMDWADDIAYSVHDLEDFHRCGALPWHRILNDDIGEQLVARARHRWFGAPSDADGRLREALRRLTVLLRGTFRELMEEPYDGSRAQRQQLRTLTSSLINRYIGAVTVRDSDDQESAIAINDEEMDEVRILKQITWDYIISSPALVAQQRGQERIIRCLFEDIYNDSKGSPPKYLPVRLRYLWDLPPNEPARFAADCVASLTEAEAVALHARLQGFSSGSVLDPIVR